MNIEKIYIYRFGEEFPVYMELKYQNYRELLRFDIDPFSLRVSLTKIFSREFHFLPGEKDHDNPMLFHKFGSENEYCGGVLIKFDNRLNNDWNVYFVDRDNNDLLYLYKAELVSSFSSGTFKNQNQNPPTPIAQVNYRAYIEGSEHTIYPDPNFTTYETLDHSLPNSNHYFCFSMVDESSFQLDCSTKQGLKYQEIEWIGYDKNRNLWSAWVLQEETSAYNKIVYLR